MTIVDIHKAETQLETLINRMLAGEAIVIAKSGQPVAHLMPIEAPQPRTPGIAKGRITNAFFEPLPEDELQAWEA
ncbi:MAG: antitoxin [Candidatus Entotheonella factor]|uniref:Antitoxin n=1 Tax=Entotheonella factor TaxID=1429438 RepID=W4LTJ8_ENTF1|nr:MAG: antitoxin [Candidatus Entotheonella factor]